MAERKYRQGNRKELYEKIIKLEKQGLDTRLISERLGLKMGYINDLKREFNTQ